MATPESLIPESYTEKIPARSHWAGEVLLARSDFAFSGEPVGYQNPEEPAITVYYGFLSTPQFDNTTVDVPIWIKTADPSQNEDPQIELCMPLANPSQHSDIYRFSKNATREWKLYVEELLSQGHDVNWIILHREEEPYGAETAIQWGNPISVVHDHTPYIVYTLSPDIFKSDDNTTDEDSDPFHWISVSERDDLLNDVIDTMQRTWRSASNFAEYFEHDRAPELYNTLDAITKRPVTSFINALIHHPNLTQTGGSWERPTNGVTSLGCSGSGILQLENTSVEVQLSHYVHERGNQTQTNSLMVTVRYIEYPFDQIFLVLDYIEQSQSAWEQTIFAEIPFPELIKPDLILPPPGKWQPGTGIITDQTSSWFCYPILEFSFRIDEFQLQSLRERGWSDKEIVDALITSAQQFPSI